jgi:hypothetical protein
MIRSWAYSFQQIEVKHLKHTNNPIFTNDYSSKYENEHIGGHFKRIETDSANFIICQRKSDYEGLKYNILLRVERFQKK